MFRTTHLVVLAVMFTGLTSSALSQPQIEIADDSYPYAYVVKLSDALSIDYREVAPGVIECRATLVKNDNRYNSTTITIEKRRFDGNTLLACLSRRQAKNWLSMLYNLR